MTNLTINDFIKGLHLCIDTETSEDCQRVKCPLFTEGMCYHSYYNTKQKMNIEYSCNVLMVNALFIIDQIQAENEKLKKKLATINLDKFAENLKDTKIKYGNDYIIYADNIDVILKNFKE